MAQIRIIIPTVTKVFEAHCKISEKILFIVVPAISLSVEIYRVIYVKASPLSSPWKAEDTIVSRLDQFRYITYLVEEEQ